MKVYKPCVLNTQGPCSGLLVPKAQAHPGGSTEVPLTHGGSSELPGFSGRLERRHCFPGGTPLAALASPHQLLLFLLLLPQLLLLDAAQLGLAGTPSLVDGLKQSGPVTGWVNNFLEGSLDRTMVDKGVRKKKWSVQGSAVLSELKSSELRTLSPVPPSEPFLWVI